MWNVKQKIENKLIFKKKEIHHNNEITSFPLGRSWPFQSSGNGEMVIAH